MKKPQDSNNSGNLAVGSRESYIYAFAVLSFWLILRVIFLLRYNDFSGDDGLYLNFAQSISKGNFGNSLLDGWLMSSKLFLWHGIVQGLIQALWLKIFGFSNWFWCAKLLPILETACLLLILSLWSIKKRIAPKFVLWLVLFVAFDPWIWTRTANLRMMTVMSLFFSLSLYFLYENIVDRKLYYSIPAGIFATIAILTKWEALAILPVAALTYLFCSGDLKTFFRNSLGFAAGFLVALSPFAIWLVSGGDRLRILIEQLHFAAAGPQLAHAAIGGGVPPFLMVFFKLAAVRAGAMLQLLTSLTFYVFGSLGSWSLITVLLFSLGNLKNRENRFWFITITLSVFTLSSYYDIHGERLMMLLPASAAAFILLANREPVKWMNYSFLSSCLIISLLFMNKALSKYATVPLYSSMNWGIRILIVYSALSGIMIIYRFATSRDMKYSNLLITATLFMVVVFYIFTSAKSALELKPGFFYSGNLTQLKDNIYQRFDDKEYRIIVSPRFYPLFPQKCKMFSQDMFVLKQYYRYWRSYDSLDKDMKPDIIFISNEELIGWIAHPIADKYLNEDFILKDSFSIKNMKFYIFNRKSKNVF